MAKKDNNNALIPWMFFSDNPEFVEVTEYLKSHYTDLEDFVFDFDAYLIDQYNGDLLDYFREKEGTLIGFKNSILMEHQQQRDMFAKIRKQAEGNPRAMRAFNELIKCFKSE